jgi:hypothetical protein
MRNSRKFMRDNQGAPQAKVVIFIVEEERLIKGVACAPTTAV